jgi:hypothetical protein
MQIRPVLSVVAVFAVLLIAPSARAEWHYSLGRYHGYGWGDGYHARTYCPPARASVYSGKPAAPPWWMTPAEQIEEVPHPAAKPAFEAVQAWPAMGPSLFRQPGEGSSVIISHAPTAPSK